MSISQNNFLSSYSREWTGLNGYFSFLLFSGNIDLVILKIKTNLTHLGGVHKAIDIIPLPLIKTKKSKIVLKQTNRAIQMNLGYLDLLN